MTGPENASPPWWSGGVVGPRPGDDLLRRAGRVDARDPRWTFANDRRSAVVLDVPGYEVSLIEPGGEVVFLSGPERLLAVADPESPGEVLALGRVEDLAEPSP